MGILDYFRHQPEPREAPRQERRSYQVIDNVIYLGPGETAGTPTGLVATPENAIRITAVYAAVRIISETIASLPLHTYQYTTNGKRLARDYSLYPILHDSFNDLMTSLEAREFLISNLLLWGNAYSELESDGAGRVEKIWPLQAAHISRVVLDDLNMRWYYYQEPVTEERPGRPRWIPGYQMWHLRGLGGNGLTGYSPIRVARSSIELSMAAEEFGARFFGNDARPGGVLLHPGQLGDDAYNRLLESWDDRHLGLRKSHRPAILEEGMKWDTVTIPPEDAQFLETRQYQVQDIARLFRLPPHMLADLSHATFTNIEHQSLEFVKHSIGPWLTRIEQSIQQNLLVGRDRSEYYVRHNVNGLLRGDIKSRYESYAIGRTNGFLSADDIRELEDMNPLPEGQGEIYLIPMNTIPAELAGAQIDQATPPATAGRSLELRADNQDNQDQQELTALLAAKRKLIKRYDPLFVQTMDRLIRREIADVKRAAVKYSKRDDKQGFISWLQGFYQEHKIFIADNLRPLIQVYGAAVMELVEAELKVSGKGKPDNFINSYVDVYGERYSTASYDQFIADMEAAEERGEEWDQAINGRLDLWDEMKAAAEARQENHRSHNAITLAGYVLLGALLKIWHIVGETCEYCTPLDGVEVPIEEPFVKAGQTLPGKDGESFTPNTKRDHPGLHWGCDCLMTAKR